jgi:hypothetical protein
MKTVQVLTGGKGRPFYDLVFRIQCKTAAIARKLTGDHRNAVPMDIEAFLLDPNTAPAMCSFRAKPRFRSRAAQQLRAQVAAIVRKDRNA